jgi:hypothetical protein
VSTSFKGSEAYVSSICVFCLPALSFPTLGANRHSFTGIDLVHPERMGHSANCSFQHHSRHRLVCAYIPKESGLVPCHFIFLDMQALNMLPLCNTWCLSFLTFGHQADPPRARCCPPFGWCFCHLPAHPILIPL